jgi:hypothetical protein
MLNTNSTPQLDEAIMNIDEDISGIDEQILALQTRRTGLVQQRKRYSNLLSPVCCLPVEIFGEIFVYATRDLPRHVLNISAVCQFWRDLALSTPMLWSTLKLGHHRTRRNMDNHINSWIERAHSYPLSLVVRTRSGFLDPVYSVLSNSLISKHQLKSITLDGIKSATLILKELESSNLEMLESFSIKYGVATNYLSQMPCGMRQNLRLWSWTPDSLTKLLHSITYQFLGDNSPA